MFNSEKLSEIIANKISMQLSLDNDKEEVLAYGAFALIQTIISIIMLAIFGIIFNAFIEILVISFASSFLRKSSGGAHASSSLNCALISVIIFGGLALLVKHYVINLEFIYLVTLVFLAYLFDLYIMYKFSPVGTSTKPLKNEHTRKRLKKLSVKIVLSLFFISISFMIIYLRTMQIQFLNIAICISVGAVWQSITMVSLGHEIIDFLDKLLRGANLLIRR
jgi:accessory gene regulator B